MNNGNSDLNKDLNSDGQNDTQATTGDLNSPHNGSDILSSDSAINTPDSEKTENISSGKTDAPVPNENSNTERKTEIENTDNAATVNKNESSIPHPGSGYDYFGRNGYGEGFYNAPKDGYCGNGVNNLGSFDQQNRGGFNGNAYPPSNDFNASPYYNGYTQNNGAYQNSSPVGQNDNGIWNVTPQTGIDKTQFSQPFQKKPEQAVNAAELLNSYLFETGGPQKIKPPKKDSAALKKLWKTVGLLLLTVTVAFCGAFACMYWVCETALLGDSDFFRTLMLENSGVTVNRVEIDKISGNYEEDTIALAEKIRQCSIDIQIFTSNNQRAGSGSGVTLSEDGLAVTNYHVVYGYETTSKAVLSDGTLCNISVLHLDKISDLAVIKIDTDKKLTPVTFADSTNAKAGQSVAICGNPLGLGSSVSFGKIGHADRDLGEVAGNFLQIDASINPGNSGGGVFDSAGNLLGIVNAKASGSNVDGIGYAIPSTRVEDVINQLLKKGYVGGRPAIGFTLVQVNESTWNYFKNGENGEPGELAEYLYEAKYGIYIIESKYNTEILKGDRIVSCDGVDFTNRDTFSQWLLKFKAGDTVSVTVERIVEKTRNDDGTYTIKRELKTFNCILHERDWIDEPYSK